MKYYKNQVWINDDQDLENRSVRNIQAVSPFESRIVDGWSHMVKVWLMSISCVGLINCSLSMENN